METVVFTFMSLLPAANTAKVGSKKNMCEMDLGCIPLVDERVQSWVEGKSMDGRIH